MPVTALSMLGAAVGCGAIKNVALYCLVDVPTGEDSLLSLLVRDVRRTTTQGHVQMPR